MPRAEMPTAPTIRERALFDAATTGTPREFVQACRAAEMEPREILDIFDAAPWRWLFSFSPDDAVTDEVRHRTFQPTVRRKLDATREYVETSWWRRLFASPAAFSTSHESVSRAR